MITAKLELLFYTDGVTVYNKFHNIMENGENLLGSFTSSQSALIVKAPGKHPSLYYVFTTAGFEANKENPVFGLSYSLVDITANNNSGKIISKNRELLKHATENLTAVKHCNNKNIWIIAHRNGNDSLVAFLLSNEGVSKNPITTTTGFKIYDTDSDQTTAIGYMKVSPKGNLIAKVYPKDDHNFGPTENSVRLYNFDRRTGKAVYFFTIPLPNVQYAYSIEFSESGRYLYVGSYTYSDPGIFQFDLQSNDSNRILQSQYFLFTKNNPSDNHFIGGMAMGPDNKIYFVQSDNHTYSLGYIHFPDSAGSRCNLLTKKVFPLPGTEIRVGLPNIAQALYNKPDIAVNGKCVPGEFEFTAHVCSWDSLHWFINDSLLPGFTGTSVNTWIDSHGAKSISAIVFSEGTSDTLRINYSFLPVPEIYLPEDTILCPGKTIEIEAISNAHQVIWSTGDISYTLSISEPGTYVATAVHPTGCNTSDSITVTVAQPPEWQISAGPFCENSPAIVAVQPASLLSDHELYWSNGEKNKLTTFYKSPGFESLTITDSFACAVVDSFFIEEVCGPVMFIPDAFSPDGNRLNETFTPKGKFIDKYYLVIYSRWGEKLFESDQLEKGWNGTFKGTDAPEGLYLYQIRYSGFKPYSALHYLKGQVSLVR